MHALYCQYPPGDRILTYHDHRLTDETICKNWKLYGHPDGCQELSMGIALPQWIVEGKNNIWVFGIYRIIFGGALPALVVCLLFQTDTCLLCSLHHL